MRTAKLAFIYSTIVVFLCFSAIGALGAFGKIEISGWATAAAIIGPILAIVSAAIGAKHIFDDPEAITELKGSHAEEVRHLQHQQADMKAHYEQLLAQVEAHFAQELSKKDSDYNALAVSAIDEKKLRIEAQRKLAEIRNAGKRPMGSMIAPGSAHTSIASLPPNQ